MPVVSVLPLRRKEVLAMLYEMGFLTAESWDEGRLLKKLHSLPRILKEGVKEPKNQEYRNLLAHICQAVMEGTELEFEQTYHLNGATPSAPGGSKKLGGNQQKGNSTMSTQMMEDKAQGKEKKVKEKKERNLDRFGTRVGSKKAKLNERLSSKPKSMRQLQEEAGLPLEQTFYNHMNNLIAKGLIEKVEEGYRVRKKD